MGLWMMFRRRWRVMLWIVFFVVIFLNALFVIDITIVNKFSGSKPSNTIAREASHLQVVRKRLNKSSSNSSSLNYIDWDPTDGAFDPAKANLNSRKRLINKEIKDRTMQAMQEENFKDEDVEDDNINIQNLDQVYGARANYSIPEVEEFVNKFQAKYQSSKYSVVSEEKYIVFLKRINALRKKGSRLPAYKHNKGSLAWERFHYGIHQYYLYDPDDVNIDGVLKDLAGNEITSVEQKEGGTQIKLIMTFENEAEALFKPMRFSREQETLPDHFYFADFERHNAEIAAFHLDKVLGFHRVPPTVGRLMNISSDIQRVADKKLAKTFFISPVGNLCFHGVCSYYCDSSHPICGHPMMVEGSLAAFLPPNDMAGRKTWRSPWKRSYSKHKKAYWEVYDDLCAKVKDKHPYNEGRRLLDVLDMSVFDFLTGNLDRHHYETFRDFGNDTFIIHLDNGRAFGKSKYDCISCLAPVRQCCMIRLSTLTKLVKFYIGPDSLSQVMRESLKSDPLNPILVEPHLDALDRRVSKILHVVNGCLKNGSSWNDVIIDDGVT
ncbi:unnamed protein product [Candidula unifasciata]|uniref:FAM20 C-terminal domain-containing protein n=1 Tax=Candidula unifasciata TaxID=100452 RepID=A0A8S3YL86_9EUPU|nr:unnamed protein product [Candidula unifasciata]